MQSAVDPKAAIVCEKNLACAHPLVTSENALVTDRASRMIGSQGLLTLQMVKDHRHGRMGLASVHLN